MLNDIDRPDEEGRYAVLCYTKSDTGEEVYVDDLCRTVSSYQDAVDIYYSWIGEFKEYLYEANVHKVIVGDSKTCEAVLFKIFNWEKEMPKEYIN